MNKVTVLNMSIALQIYEWFNTWLIIKFQKKYDITDVHIEKRKFTPIEKNVYYLFIAVHVAYFVSTNIAIILIDMTRKESEL